MDFYSRYSELISQNYPEVDKDKLASPWQDIVSSEIVPLSTSASLQIQDLVSRVYQLKHQDFYKKLLKDQAPKGVDISHKQDSVLMTYDFHLDEQGKPRLIEVNTNGSGFLISQLVYEAQGLASKQQTLSLKQAFASEWQKFSNSDSLPCRVAIMDSNPYEEKMLLEFFFYKKFLASMGWQADIYSIKDLKPCSKGNLKDTKGQKIDFVYNRSTDFYFKEHASLLQIYASHRACFSPNPSEYYLLADKARLCEWSSNKEILACLKQAAECLLPTSILTKDVSEEVWKNKKKYFFKPLQGYAGKQVYRGKNLTSSKFKDLLKTPSIYQEYVVPSTHTDSQGESWKVDFRAYAYGASVQMLVARLYKGQVTNFSSQGGFAAVKVCEDK